MRPLYELLELVLLPIRMEGLSQSLLEAMALGKPAIASAAAGNLDLVTAGSTDCSFRRATRPPGPPPSSGCWATRPWAAASGTAAPRRRERRSRWNAPWSGPLELYATMLRAARLP